MLLGSKYPKNNYLNFENNITVLNQRSKSYLLLLAIGLLPNLLLPARAFYVKIVSSAVFLIVPNHRLFHPKKYVISLYTKQ